MTNDKRLTAEELSAIKERAEKATAGPWSREFGETVDGIEIVSDSIKGCLREVVSIDSGVVRYPDMHFIAHSRDDIPKLLAEVERLKKIEAEAIEIIGEMYGGCRDDIYFFELVNGDDSDD